MELDGISHIEGKTAREAASKRSRGDASDMDGQTERSKWAGAHESMRAASEFQTIDKSFLPSIVSRLYLGIVLL
jgi:hypothetical protein